MLPHAGEIEADRSAAAALSVFVPVPRLRKAKRAAGGEVIRDPLACGFGGPLHGRFGDPQTRHFRQHPAGRFVETFAQLLRQADQLFRGGRERTRRQADGLIPGNQAVTAAAAVVIGPLAGDLPQRAQRRFVAVSLEFGGVRTDGAIDATAVATDFFKRSSSAAAPR